jgi:hypothetical protein
MNIADRTALYHEILRILKLSGRFTTHDVVLRLGDIAFPVPWARDSSTSFLLSEGDTRTLLQEAGFTPVFWRDDTEIALEWFKTAMTGQTQNEMNLGLVMGPDMREMTSNLARNLREGRLGVLSAVLRRD